LLFASINNDKPEVMGKGSIQKALKKVLVKCGNHKLINPHSLRRYFTTCLLEQSMDIRSLQILLGHNSLNPTVKYTQLTTLKQKIMYRRLMN